MALSDNKINSSDYTGKDISGLSNKPMLPAQTLKARFDALVKNVVAVKFNALIDAVSSAITGVVKKVSGGTSGNLASLTADGSIADSGKKAADFEAANAVSTHNTSIKAHGGIPTRHEVYKTTGGFEWFKILSFPTTYVSVVRVEGYSLGANYDQRGHFKIIINRGSENRADLIYATNGLTASNFDVRLSGSTIKLYFLAPQYTIYKILSESLYENADITTPLTTYSVAEAPSGTAITVSSNIHTYRGNVTVNDLGTTIAIPWAKTTMAYSVNRNDYHLPAVTAPGQASPINISCVSDGSIKVLWDRTVDDTVVTVPVTIIGIET